MRNRIGKGIYLTLAFIFMGLGMIGIPLPVLPTTPFLLLASYCFMKGSDRFYLWFTSTKTYKKYLLSYTTLRSMTLKTKWCILIPASFMCAAAFVFAPIWHVRVFLLLVVLVKYYYFFFRIKTIKPNEAMNNEVKVV